jgi:hypothetical protein
MYQVWSGRVNLITFFACVSAEAFYRRGIHFKVGRDNYLACFRIHSREETQVNVKTVLSVKPQISRLIAATGM